MNFIFKSRLANVLGTKGLVSCDQPLASQIGCNILQAGGNAADAAVAMAAVMAVTEPFSNGLGGDAFCLNFNRYTKSIRQLNGSGRSPSALTHDYVTSKGYSIANPIPDEDGLNINVPAAPAAYCDILSCFGSGNLNLETLWKPAILLAENGFPVSEVSAQVWQNEANVSKLLKFDGYQLLIDGRPPKVGEIMKNPALAKTLKKITTDGKQGFYESYIAEAVINAVQDAGGVMQLQDLQTPTFTPSDPISTPYKTIRLWETTPNSDGIIALLALNILEGFNLKELGHNSSEYLHLLIEAIKLSMADGFAYVAESKPNMNSLLTKEYAVKRRALINKTEAQQVYVSGQFPGDGNTTYIAVIDQDGNACSLITSLSAAFGSGVVPKNCGFALNNRGRFFSMQHGHPNVIGPSKRSFNTIIPAMITDESTGDLLCCYGIMGGLIQPQAHVQVLLNMLEFNMTPQEALNAARIFINAKNPNAKQDSAIGPVLLEEGISPQVLQTLKSKGHVVSELMTNWDRLQFGRGHVITKGAWWKDENYNISNDSRVLWGASDPRCDGCALAH
uniref:Gamma-glutamyltransferase n=1 Tax=Strigamia maritima TaxID=126957 RepID=T1IU93_STRMM